MEITTCEQYVLKELDNTQKRLDDLSEKYSILNKEYVELSKRYDRIIKIFNPKITKCSSDSEMYKIDTKSIWSAYDKEDYNELVSLLGLEFKEENED